MGSSSVLGAAHLGLQVLDQGSKLLSARLHSIATVRNTSQFRVQKSIGIVHLTARSFCSFVLSRVEQSTLKMTMTWIIRVRYLEQDVAVQEPAGVDGADELQDLGKLHEK